jgi:hypothetical protein
MTDNESLAVLQKALQDGRADVSIASGLTSHLDFPGNSETDKGQFALIGLILLVIAYWKGNLTIVGIAAVALIAIYWLVWRRVVRQRTRKRFIVKVMSDLKLWRKSWTFNGVKLTAQGRECLSPKGDWRSFAANLGGSSTVPSSDGAPAGIRP